jgi:hypothetical protein
MRSMVSTCPHVEARCYPPPCLGVTRGDHVSWPTMKTVIPMMMMMISMPTHGNPTAPLQMPLSLLINEAYHIQTAQFLEDGGPA